MKSILKYCIPALAGIIMFLTMSVQTAEAQNTYLYGSVIYSNCGNTTGWTVEVYPDLGNPVATANISPFGYYTTSSFTGYPDSGAVDYYVGVKTRNGTVYMVRRHVIYFNNLAYPEDLYVYC